MKSTKALLLIAVVLIGIILIAGCSKKDPLSPAGNTAPPQIMPLEIGSLWTYMMSIYNPTDGTLQVTLDYYLELMDTMTINDDLFFVGRHIFTDGSSADTSFWYYTLRANGVHVREFPASPEYMKIKFPAAVGDNFTAINEFLASGFNIWASPAEVISLQESVTVPLGTYTCLHNSLDVDGAFQHEYYNLGVGLVKTDLRIYDNISEYQSYIVMELVQYDP